MPDSALTVHLSEDGYLRIESNLTRQYFPEDTLIAFWRDSQLILMPTRGASAGGLILKQRNAAGDRVVLLAELFQFREIPSGVYAGAWDNSIGAIVLRRCTEPQGASPRFEKSTSQLSSTANSS